MITVCYTPAVCFEVVLCRTGFCQGPCGPGGAERPRCMVSLFMPLALHAGGAQSPANVSALRYMRCTVVMCGSLVEHHSF